MLLIQKHVQIGQKYTNHAKRKKKKKKKNAEIIIKMLFKEVVIGIHMCADIVLLAYICFLLNVSL